MHFIERYNMMVVKVQSKFQLRRICAATGAIPLVRLVSVVASFFLPFVNVPIYISIIGSTNSRRIGLL